ncbi:MAG: hypothetical protein ACLRMZ_26450 [Blautia marasmi]
MTVLCDGLCRLFSSTTRITEPNHLRGQEIINEHVDEKITLNQLSDVFNISPNYLSILFSKYNDMGFIDYVNHARLNVPRKCWMRERSRSMRSPTNWGKSAFYFSRVFKVEGVSPRDYINRT